MHNNITMSRRTCRRLSPSQPLSQHVSHVVLLSQGATRARQYTVQCLSPKAGDSNTLEEWPVSLDVEFVPRLKLARDKPVTLKQGVGW